MVKLRYNQPAHLLRKKEVEKTRPLLSFSNFRRSSTVPSERPNSRLLGRMPSSVEAAHPYLTLNLMGNGVPEADSNTVSPVSNGHVMHFSIPPADMDTRGLTCPDTKTKSQILSTLKEISSPRIQEEHPSAVTQAALVFQRWRNAHLKTLFSQEVKKVLEEAQKDEACLVSMEREISNKEEQLARALADSAQLRAQLSAINFANDQNQSSNQVEQRHQVELLEAIKRAKSAEATVEEKETEIKTLRENLKIMDNEECMTVSKLEADIASLRNENDCSSREIGNLMDQLADKDQEILSQTQTINSLLFELGGLRKRHVKQIKSGLNSQDENDSNKINCSLEELGMSLQCRSHEQPKTRELGMSLQCRSHEQPKTREAVSLELEEHLKRLTAYVRNLEMCIQKGENNAGYEKRLSNKQQRIMHKSNLAMSGEPVTVCVGSSDTMHRANSIENTQNRTISEVDVKKSSYYLHSDFEFEMPRDGIQKSTMTRQAPYLYQNRNLISWTQSHSQERITAVATVDSPKKFTNLLSRCISWKWRWAAAASQLRALSKELQTMTITKRDKTMVNLTAREATAANHDKFITSMQKLGFIHVQNLNSSHSSNKMRNGPAKIRQKEAKFSVPGHKVISIVLSMWRASIKNAKLEKEAVNKGEKLSRLLSGLPWLIQRFEERRHLERMFHHWVLHMLRSKLQIYHASIHHSGSWSCWQKRPASSLWMAQLGLADPRAMEGNGYQGRYMRYGHTKPNERQVISLETRKGYSKSSNRRDLTTCSQDYLEQNCFNRDAEACVDSSPCELSCSSQKDNRLSLRHSKCITSSPESPGPSNKIAVGHGNNALGCTDDLAWNKRYNVTSFTEKAMQALQVSLYNELQKLQDLIVKEARFHQEKVGNRKRDTNQEEVGSNASPFSTSLWRICNGLAHCLIEARNQILALAGNSEPKPCPKLGSTLKPCKKSIRISSHPILANKTSEKSYEKTRVRFSKVESKSKREKYSFRKAGHEHNESTGSTEILEFVGAGKVTRDMTHDKVVNSPLVGNRYSLMPPKVRELGIRYGSLMESKTQLKLAKK